MALRSEHARLAAKVPMVLAEVLEVSPADIALHAVHPSGADVVASAAGQTYVVEFTKSGGAGAIASAAKKVLELAGKARRRGIPLVSVPFMGEVGRMVCREAGVGWLDLSGNAHIVAPGIRVNVAGKPNRFRSAGRPPNLFAPKSARVTRWFLTHPDAPIRQRELARATGLDEGFVSRLVSRLEREQYLVRDAGGGVRPRDPALLLDAWREAYQFSRHTLHQGHVAARSGDALLRLVVGALVGEGVAYAATGLAAAWALTRFAAFRTATVYVPDDPSPAFLERLGFREDPRGGNLWLVVPNDGGVFAGAVEKDGIRCVHPVQVYVDLKAHPERATEAAERLRAELLHWGRGG
jgi:hypothetical protein